MGANKEPASSANKPTTTNQGGRHRKLIHLEPFNLYSPNNQSLRNAMRQIEEASLNRLKVCVISVVSKESLKKSVMDHLVQFVLGKENNKKQESSDEDKKESGHSYENQVLGQIDTKAEIVVLNMVSFLRLDKAHSLCDNLCDEDLPQQDYPATLQALVMNMWPRWNQNLLKTMLILSLVSHIIVFYNPLPAIDFNLIQTFRELEILRLNSQIRVKDLLETVAAKQVFSPLWIRQARLASPRALFVCDTSYVDLPLTKPDVIEMKRSIEDQIHKILIKAGVIFRPPHQAGLITLPDRSDFVYIMWTKRAQKSLETKVVQVKKVEEDMIDKQVKFYSQILQSMELNDIDLQNVARPESSQEKTSSIETINPPELKKNLDRNSHPGIFKKFIFKHVAEIQALSQVDLGNKQSSSRSSQNNVILPRLDDLFTVLIELTNLLFPVVAPKEDKEADVAPGDYIKSWREPDERRFIGIYHLSDVDSRFSVRYCEEMRHEAFRHYVASLSMRPRRANAFESTIQLYKTHARGPFSQKNLDLLIEQCKAYSDEASRCKSSGSQAVQQKTTTSRSGSRSKHRGKGRQSNETTMHRHLNGVKISTACDCGREVELFIEPKDSKKRLERVNVTRLD